MALPCLVPQQWIYAPNAEDEDRRLVDDGLPEDDENTAMLKYDWKVALNEAEPEYDEYRPSDAYETDDDLRAKWRRKKRRYRSDLAEREATRDSAWKGTDVSPDDQDSVTAK